MMNKIFIFVVFSHFISGIPTTTYGQAGSLEKSINRQTFKEYNLLLSDLENQTLNIIMKYANIQAHDKSCKFITKDMERLLSEWFDAGILKGKKKQEAFIVNVGFGKTYKENNYKDVIVVELGLAIEQPYNFIFRRITYPLKNNYQSPERSPYKENDFNYQDVKS